MSRTVPEWIGKTDDTPVPPRVKARVMGKFNFRCHWSGREIKAGDRWDVDHMVAIINGGENRESNLAPILSGKPHKEKTAQDLAIKSKTYRMHAKHFGIIKPKGRIQNRGFQK